MRIFDYTKLGDCKWDSEILGLIAQIHEYKGRQELYLKRKPAELDRLVEIAKIQSTEASNKIEGIVTTNARIKQLCLEKTTPRTRDEKEILGYRDVLNTIHENFEYIPIRASYILQLHRDLYRYSDKSIGGRFKIRKTIFPNSVLTALRSCVLCRLNRLKRPMRLTQFAKTITEQSTPALLIR